MADDAHTNASLIGRLLEEISWEGNRVRLYRRGGLGMENVLTTEVLSPLSYLPRQHFLGEVLRAAHGAEAAMAAAASEIEDADRFILPPQLTLQPGAVVVQPDAVIESPNNYVLVEAKRIRRATFQPEQLAREYLAVHRQAGRPVPALLLILGSAPPVMVKRHGPRDIPHTIAAQLPAVLAKDRARGGLRAPGGTHPAGRQLDHLGGGRRRCPAAAVDYQDRGSVAAAYSRATGSRGDLGHPCPLVS